MSVAILHLDEAVVVASKAAGMFTHPTPLGPREETLIDQVGRLVSGPLHPVHRLDRPTSGPVLLARSKEAAAALQASLSAADAVKGYLVLCRGAMKEPLTMDRPLTHLDTGVVQEAHTHFVPLATLAERCTLARAAPRTGRRHQIRRHLAHAAHHAIGDTRYGKGGYNRYYREHFGLPRLALHLGRLALAHPAGGRLDLTVPPPDDLLSFLRRLPGWEEAHWERFLAAGG